MDDWMTMDPWIQYLSRCMDFFSEPPPLWKFQLLASYISFNFFGCREPSRNFLIPSVGAGEDGYFWNCTIWPDLKCNIICHQIRQKGLTSWKLLWSHFHRSFSHRYRLVKPKKLCRQNVSDCISLLFPQMSLLMFTSQLCTGYLSPNSLKMIQL